MEFLLSATGANRQFQDEIVQTDGEVLRHPPEGSNVDGEQAALRHLVEAGYFECYQEGRALRVMPT